MAIAIVINTNPTEITLLLPNLADNLSLFAAAGINPNGSGRNLTAASRAVCPLTSWKCNICVNMKENITNEANIIAINPKEKPLNLKNPIGNIGYSTFLSQFTNK